MLSTIINASLPESVTVFALKKHSIPVTNIPYYCQVQVKALPPLGKVHLPCTPILEALDL